VTRRRSRNSITLRVLNPNGQPAQVVSTDGADFTARDGVLPLNVQPAAEADLPAYVDASRATDLTFVLQGVLVWFFEGQERRQQFEVTMVTEGAATSDSAFESMFDV